jgi:hypothetical protein
MAEYVSVDDFDTRKDYLHSSERVFCFRYELISMRTQQHTFDKLRQIPLYAKSSPVYSMAYNTGDDFLTLDQGYDG